MKAGINNVLCIEMPFFHYLVSALLSVYITSLRYHVVAKETMNLE